MVKFNVVKMLVHVHSYRTKFNPVEKFLRLRYCSKSPIKTHHSRHIMYMHCIHMYLCPLFLYPLLLLPSLICENSNSSHINANRVHSDAADTIGLLDTLLPLCTLGSIYATHQQCFHLMELTLQKRHINNYILH